MGKPVADFRGKTVGEVLPLSKTILAHPEKREILKDEIILGAGDTTRYYSLNLTPLADRNGELLGQLLLLHDITDQKLAQESILEQQRVLATLRERERLARELHDGIGQVLGYLGIQAQSVRKYVQDGNDEKADSILKRLVEVAKDAHADVRESILDLRLGRQRTGVSSQLLNITLQILRQIMVFTLSCRFLVSWVSIALARLWESSFYVLSRKQ